MTTIMTTTAVQLVYLVAGAERQMYIYGIAARLKGTNPQHPLTDAGGHIGMVTALQKHAERVATHLDIHLRDPDAEFPGVFEYEVTEELGAWLADNPNASLDEFTDELRRCSAAFFAQ